MIRNDEELIQWSYDIVQNAYLNKQEDIGSQENHYLGNFVPFSLSYIGQTNPSLIFGGHSVTNLPNKGIITVRDGLIPLTIFFRDIDPAAVKGDVLIHKDLWYAVPEKWQKKVKFYEIEADTYYHSGNLPKKIFISGILNSSLADPEELDEMIKHLLDTIGKDNLKDIQIMAYFPNKPNDMWGNWQEENVLRYTQSIFSRLKFDIYMPEWRLIQAENDFKDCLYYEVNAGTFIKDSYLLHFTLSRGAGLLKPESKKIDSAFTFKSETRLSLYHKMKVYEFDFSQVDAYRDPFSAENFHYFRKLIEASNQHKKINYKWERWFATYLKKFFKDNKTSRFI